MRVYKLIWSLLLLCGACSSSTNEKETSDAEGTIKVDTTVAAQPVDSVSFEQPEFPTLTQENHVEILTEYWGENTERTLRLKTSKGDIDIRLSEQTPIHSATFLMLAKRDYFDETLFTRVVPKFIIQGGSSDADEIELKRMLIGSFTPYPEFHDNLIHRRGAVSMARHYKNNPEKRSTPYSFFIVVGRTFDTPAIMGIERDHNKSFDAEDRQIYKELGGAPHLDGEHTVFGEVISGMDVVDAISEVEADLSEWPKRDIVIEDVELLE